MIALLWLQALLPVWGLLSRSHSLKPVHTLLVTATHVHPKRRVIGSRVLVVWLMRSVAISVYLKHQSTSWLKHSSVSIASTYSLTTPARFAARPLQITP